MTRVMVVDDQQMFRVGLRAILQAQDDVEVVGEAANGADAVVMAIRLRPDVILMDVRMPELDGIEATRRITAAPAESPVRVVMLTTFDIDDYVFDALRAGASGFLLKDASAEELVQAVRTVAAGDSLLAPRVTRRLVEAFVAGPQPAAPRTEVLDVLTDRERDVFLLMARGRSNGEIAAELFIAEQTVKTHVGRVLAKLQLRDRVHAVVLAYESGLVTPSA
ncbi:response regulator [Curtobacterium flaccumfaciens]|uniref:response regulator n=1 Tax=Curtobacterium flaccumfaciens TaxID=2035 RepID=UPI000FFF4FBC|nr:response regulator transcription factor [Curtobacterium flaccumfaciens]MCS0646214.1 response regulator transcription factor [Curtobacterium flaccumfaciens pv. flaccumfaciens]MCS6526411.1 response regulator transcription factor [Curtobacterium flaccumfaciens pv. flaccumfaciens]MCS6528235.1 response regulator transcription factor [Curtobacterium flaccumfaciens pv. flaccumfaciens]NUU11855.1 response regulator transcription factor [Curtobacterium flaccumfaciens]RXF85705.1 DNA-binding response r